ncbi:hypothetical protein [Streptomyces sp. NPDC055794]
MTTSPTGTVRPDLAAISEPIFPDWRRWRSTRMAPALKSTSDTFQPRNSPVRKPDPAGMTIAARMYGGITRAMASTGAICNLLVLHGRKGDPGAGWRR